MYYRLGRAGKALDRFGVIEFATTIAPGVRDVLLSGKVYEAVERNSRNKGAIQYDAVVLDAPPTGRITNFLNVGGEVGGLAKVGPIKTQSDTMMKLFQSPRTAVHLVTLLEEMPVQETIDGIAELKRAKLPVGGVVVNMVRPRDLSDEDLAAARAGTLDRERVESEVKAAGIEVTPALIDGLLHEAAEHAERRALEDAQRQVVAGLGVPDLRAAPDAGWRRPGRALRVRRPAPRAGDGMSPHDEDRLMARRTTQHQTRVGPTSPSARRAGPLDVDALLADREDRDHRVLRLGRRRQDDHVGRARPAGRGAGADASSYSRSTRPAGSPSRWASRRSTTPRGRCRTWPATAGSTR